MRTASPPATTPPRPAGRPAPHRAVHLAPAVVGDHQAVRPVAGAAARVAGSGIPFTSRGSRVPARTARTPSQVKPGAVKRPRAWSTAARRSASGGRAARRGAPGRRGSWPALAVQEGQVADLHVALAPAQQGRVQGEHDGRVAGGLGRAQQAGRQGRVLGGVELEPARVLAVRLGDRLQRGRRGRRRHQPDAGARPPRAPRPARRRGGGSAATPIGASITGAASRVPSTSTERSR